MKCWCDEIEYNCDDCEKRQAWGSLSDIQKVKLIRYVKNPEDKNLTKWTIENGLCVSVVPDRYA